ncbi:hypothetical protein SRIMM317S_03774 [Streptomyces rimosus subsp. rimosus]
MPVRRWRAVVAAMRSGAPTKARANQPFRIAELMRCIAATNVASSVWRSPGITAMENAKKRPAMRPVASVAANRVAARAVSYMGWRSSAGRCPAGRWLPCPADQ